ncbi:MAG: carbohydrate kinase family protein [Bacteroidota bacterium]|nr:carbohydrate kinase family protein [Bacteroidota bacterium]
MAAKKPFKISGTGCALVDYLYKPVDFQDKDFLRYQSKAPGDGGLAPGKLVFKEEFEKFSGENYMEVRNRITKGKQPVALNIGGPSIVSLIHAAQILQGLPAEVNFHGCIGSDTGSNFLKTKLAQTPLKIGKYKTSSQYTPFTDVFSDPDFDAGHGERAFINNIGAAWDFFPEDLDDSFFESDLVAFGGTALVPNIHSSLGELLYQAKENEAITVVNTVYDFLNEKKNPSKSWPLGSSMETYSYIDLLITDMEESLRLSGTSSVDAAINFFQSTGVGAVIITHGSNVLHFFANNSLFGKISSSTLPVSEKVVSELRQNPEQAGDTTGCGDNFAGGMIASIAMQLKEKPKDQVSLKNAIALGVVSGGFTCFYHGGTFYEEFPGQKMIRIEHYLKEYLTQIGI